MKSPLLIFTLILIVSWGKAQDNDTQTSPEDNQSKNTFSISFEKTKLEVKRSNDSIIIPIKVKTIIFDKGNWDGYTLSIEPNPDKSTLSTSEYKLEFNNWDFKNIKDKSFNAILIIKKESLPDRDRKLVLRIKTEKEKKDVKDQNSGENKEITIEIKHTSEFFNNSSFVSYIGTNFDLVERIKAENLFFATSALIEPDKQNKGLNQFGLYLNIYGNRTMSSKEEFQQNFFTDLTPVTQDTSYLISKDVNIIRTMNVDNLGAHFSTLHPICNSRGKGKGELKTYLTLSMDFIWRRTNISTQYGEVAHTDTLMVPSNVEGITINPLVNNNVTFSQFDFNIGPGFFFLFENDNISFRIHGAVGYTRTFTVNSEDEQFNVTKEKRDIFFTGRAWITEPKTGLTLQAEIMNRAYYPKPFYGVTLSKAFNLEKLAGVFAPVTTN